MKQLPLVIAMLSAAQSHAAVFTGARASSAGAPGAAAGAAAATKALNDYFSGRMGGLETLKRVLPSIKAPTGAGDPVTQSVRREIDGIFARQGTRLYKTPADAEKLAVIQNFLIDHVADADRAAFSRIAEEYSSGLVSPERQNLQRTMDQLKREVETLDGAKMLAEALSRSSRMGEGGAVAADARRTKTIPRGTNSLGEDLLDDGLGAAGPEHSEMPKPAAPAIPGAIPRGTNSLGQNLLEDE